MCRCGSRHSAHRPDGSDPGHLRLCPVYRLQRARESVHSTRMDAQSHSASMSVLRFTYIRLLSSSSRWRNAPTQFFPLPAGGDWLHGPGHGHDPWGRESEEIWHGRADDGCAGHPPHCSGGGSHHRAGRTPAAPKTKELSLWWASQTHFVSFLSRYVKSDSCFIWNQAQQPPHPTCLMVVSSEFPLRALLCVTCYWHIHPVRFALLRCASVFSALFYPLCQQRISSSAVSAPSFTFFFFFFSY